MINTLTFVGLALLAEVAVVLLAYYMGYGNGWLNGWDARRGSK